MNASATQGRIRVRNEALKVAEIAYGIRDSLFEMKGVLSVQVNKRVGSVLVLFDKAKISAEKIVVRAAEALGIDVEKVRKGLGGANRALTGRKGRRYVKRGMLGAFGAALGVLYWSEKLHVAAGAAFVPLVALHVYQNRKTLLK